MMDGLESEMRHCNNRPGSEEELCGGRYNPQEIGNLVRLT